MEEMLAEIGCQGRNEREPLSLKGMLNHVVDAGLHTPTDILIEERPDGSTCIVYDRMASFVAPYGNSDALKVARGVDAKIERILTEAAK